MAFWSTQTIKSYARANPEFIASFNEKRVQQGAYELSLSDQALTTPFRTSRANPPEDGVLMIAPGQFGLLYTAERVQIPPNVIAFISVRASVKFKGLVNISGFHVDPGYCGHLKFSVYNAGTETVPLGVGDRTFLIWFADLDQATEDPYAPPHEHVGQIGITPQDRLRMQTAVPSPQALDQRLKTLEERWETGLAVCKYFVLPMAVALMAGAVLWLLTVILPTRHSRDSHEKHRNDNRAVQSQPSTSADLSEQSIKSPTDTPKPSGVTADGVPLPTDAPSKSITPHQ
jgi:dCTP deaminase